MNLPRSLLPLLPGAVVGLSLAVDRVRLAVKNNGRGLPAAPHQSGAGLRIMQYRAGMFDGSVTVQNGEPDGVTVSCTLHQSAPLTEEKVPR